jgi:anti-sigma B factor antagonist
VKEMEISERERDGIIILDIKGEVDIYSGEDLRQRLEELSLTDRQILLNISNTDYIDSFGLSLLISFRKRMGKKGRHFGLCSPQSYVRRILNLTKLYDFLAVFENEEKAVQTFQNPQEESLFVLEPRISVQSEERRV